MRSSAQPKTISHIHGGTGRSTRQAAAFGSMALVITAIGFSCTDTAGRLCGSTFDSLFRFTMAWLRFDPALYSSLRFVAEKSIHVGLFSALGIVLWHLFRPVEGGRVWAVAIGLALGCSSECLQRLFPTRDPAIRDMMINWASVTVAVVIASKFVTPVQRTGIGDLVRLDAAVRRFGDSVLAVDPQASFATEVAKDVVTPDKGVL